MKAALREFTLVHTMSAAWRHEAADLCTKPIGLNHKPACRLPVNNTHHRHHRLRGSASPVLTATHHSYGSPRLSDFFVPLGSGGQTPQRTFTQNGSNDVFSRKDVPFAVKVATVYTP